MRLRGAAVRLVVALASITPLQAHAGGPAPAIAPAFALVVRCGPDGGRCLAGQHAAGLDVLLLSVRAPCTMRTGRPATWRRPSSVPPGPALPATALIGRCEGDFAVAAIGARLPEYSAVERAPVRNPVQMESLLERFAAAGALDAAFERARTQGDQVSRDDLADESPAEAFALAGVPRSPAFVRFPLKRHPMNGPLLVAAGDHVTAPFGACSDALHAFRLGGRFFLLGAGRCCACAWRIEQVFELEGGELRPVFASGEPPAVTP